jgi:hypothetical protein
MKNAAKKRVSSVGVMVVLGGLVMLPLAYAQQNPAVGKKRGPGGEGKGESRMPTLAFRTEVPVHPVDVILGRPTNDAVTASVLSYEGFEGYVTFGPTSEKMTHETPRQKFLKDIPAEITLAGLRADTRYVFDHQSEEIPLGGSRESVKGLRVFAINYKCMELHVGAGQRELFGGGHGDVHLVTEAV